MSRTPQRTLPLRWVGYVAVDAHRRATDAMQVATQHIRPKPAFVRYARSASAEPNALERLMRLAEQLRALGATRDDLRGIEIAFGMHLDDLYARDRRPLGPLMVEALSAEHVADHAEYVVLADPDNPAALRALAAATRREAALDLECARIADADADRLEGK